MDITQITQLQKALTVRWHRVDPVAAGDGLEGLAEENHLENFSLWHEEDVARRDDLGPERVRVAKRRIDRHNQQRNDLIEQMDQFIVVALQPRESGCSFNSETPGMMIDRLSILALKEFHMLEEAARDDATDQHRKKCEHKVGVIRQQISDLSNALTELLNEVQAGTRSFRVYYQFKMYNDAELNPQLRKAA